MRFYMKSFSTDLFPHNKYTVSTHIESKKALLSFANTSFLTFILPGSHLFQPTSLFLFRSLSSICYTFNGLVCFVL